MDKIALCSFALLIFSLSSAISGEMEILSIAEYKSRLEQFSDVFLPKEAQDSISLLKVALEKQAVDEDIKACISDVIKIVNHDKGLRIVAVKQILHLVHEYAYFSHEMICQACNELAIDAVKLETNAPKQLELQLSILFTYFSPANVESSTVLLPIKSEREYELSFKVMCALKSASIGLFETIKTMNVPGMYRPPKEYHGRFVGGMDPADIQDENVRDNYKLYLQQRMFVNSLENVRNELEQKYRAYLPLWCSFVNDGIRYKLISKDNVTAYFEKYNFPGTLQEEFIGLLNNAKKL